MESEFELKKVTRREIKNWPLPPEETIPKIYKVCAMHIRVRNLLGSIHREKEYLKYIIKQHNGDEESADVDEATYELCENEAVQVFRRDSEGRIYFAYGQITGWLDEAVRSLGLKRKLPNFKLTVHTWPRRIFLYRDGQIIKETDGVVVRAIKAYAGGQYLNTLAVHEVIRQADMYFYLLMVNKDIEKVLETLLDVAGRVVSMGPGRRHGYGEVTLIEYCPIR